MSDNCPLGAGQCLNTVSGRSTIVRKSDLIDYLTQQGNEALSIRNAMLAQGDMPNDAAFQDGIWSMTQRLIRKLSE